MIIGQLLYDKEVLIGVREGRKIVKSEEEYTSPVSKIYKVENEYIIITENSIYVYPQIFLLKEFRSIIKLI